MSGAALTKVWNESVYPPRGKKRMQGKADGSPSCIKNVTLRHIIVFFCELNYHMSKQLSKHSFLDQQGVHVHDWNKVHNLCELEKCPKSV